MTARPSLPAAEAASHAVTKRLPGALAALLIALTLALAGALGGALPASAATPDGVTLEITPPDLTQEDTLQEVTVTVTNTSDASMRKGEVTLDPPPGWIASPATVDLPMQLRSGESAEATFTVRVPTLRDGFRIHEFGATVVYRGGDGAGSASWTVNVRTGEPVGSLTEVYDNVGTTTLETRAAGDFDGEGNSFSDEQLAAQGLTPGAAVEALGATFTWPDVATDAPDNVTASGQAIELDGTGSSLAFLLSGSSTSASGVVTVYYTDGTSSSAPLGTPNWSFQEATAYGATLVAATDGRNRPSGYGDAAYQYRVFANSVPLTAGKTVDFVVLPSSGSIHVFDMEIVA